VYYPLIIKWLYPQAADANAVHDPHSPWLLTLVTFPSYTQFLYYPLELVVYKPLGILFNLVEVTFSVLSPLPITYF